MPLSIALAGSTERALVCAQAILEAEDLSLDWVLTPEPKLVGREQKLEKNLIHLLALSEDIPALLVREKIDDQIKKGVTILEEPDFLLVVDFGYLLPTWLLKKSRVATLNIHPSALPAWRGSSPGQFVILAGQKSSAVSLIKMTSALDKGPIYWQKEFDVDSNWTQTEYYQTSFGLIAENLAKIINQIGQGQLEAQPQPDDSPTVEARRLTKNDAYLPWSQLKTAQNVKSEVKTTKLKIEIPKTSLEEPLLEKILEKNTTQNYPQIIKQATQAFKPWPVVWTKLPTKKGVKRMQLLEVEISPEGELQLREVKIAGLKKTPWNQVKNLEKSK